MKAQEFEMYLDRAIARGDETITAIVPEVKVEDRTFENEWARRNTTVTATCYVRRDGSDKEEIDPLNLYRRFNAWSRDGDHQVKFTSDDFFDIFDWLTNDDTGRYIFLRQLATNIQMLQDNMEEYNNG